MLGTRRKRIATAPAVSKPVREPKIIALRSFGAACPAGYQAGERFPLDEWWPEGSFRCVRAFEALKPYIDAIETRLDRTTYPPCQMVASCKCPLTDSEVVFCLYSEPVDDQQLS